MDEVVEDIVEATEGMLGPYTAEGHPFPDEKGTICLIRFNSL